MSSYFTETSNGFALGTQDKSVDVDDGEIRTMLRLDQQDLEGTQIDE